MHLVSEKGARMRLIPNKKGVWGPKMERAWTCQKWFRGKMTSSCASTYHSGISKDLRTHVASCRVRMTWRNHNEDNQEEHKKSDLSSRQRKERPLQFQSGGQIRRSSFDLQVSKPWQKTGHWSFWKWTCQLFQAEWTWTEDNNDDQPEMLKIDVFWRWSNFNSQWFYGRVEERERRIYVRKETWIPEWLCGDPSKNRDHQNSGITQLL